ncbi:MAG: cobalt-precorrin-5B (C(1))-methyltransferase [Bacteroidaceae bacterium]|nr:cobalt-precorrin-5B (C(1))-methyltransferase [Bacteroidaceae bacterium]
MKSILVFGGTTEGRKSIEALEEAGNPFYYSTKTGEQDVSLHHGIPLSGVMDKETMISFCRTHNVGLLVDAAHPFAEVLHQTVAKVAEQLDIPAIRFERIFPQREADIIWCDDFDDALNKVDCHVLLATTGVQSIAKLKPLEERDISVRYRILNRESSIHLAHEQGATDEQLCFYPQTPDADAMLMKESGETGGFVEKVEEARRMGMKMYAIKRPETPKVFHQVNGEHGLRRMVERLLPDFYPLHSGLTTGTCATAAVVAATIRLMTGEAPDNVPVRLPNGETIHVAVGYGDGYAFCIKEAGDDPDVTDGIEIRAQVERSERFEIIGGEGVGRFTLPGFDYPAGESAINKAPRQMMRNNIKEEVCITISVPQGAEIARRTFNPRLGIEGGISIIGVSGIVKPFSEEAFIESIHKCLEVAKASGTERVVLHSGMKSENFLQQNYPHLPQQAFVEYGNAIGETLRIANELQLPHVTLGIMLGKAVKLAEGHLDTHSKKQTMNKAFINEMLLEAGCDTEVIAKATGITLARELWSIIPAEHITDFAKTVIGHCEQHCRSLLPQGELTILLIDDNGHIYGA